MDEQQWRNQQQQGPSVARNRPRRERAGQRRRNNNDDEDYEEEEIEEVEEDQDTLRLKVINRRRVHENHQESETEVEVEFELLPADLFKQHLPQKLVNDYSHWLNEDEETVYFRPKRFDSPLFNQEGPDAVPYKFVYKNNQNYVLDTKTGSKFVSSDSETFKSLVRGARTQRALSHHTIPHFIKHETHSSLCPSPSPL
jgi:hypothetical protein